MTKIEVKHVDSATDCEVITNVMTGNVQVIIY